MYEISKKNWLEISLFLFLYRVEENVEVTYDNDTCMDLKNMDRFKFNFHQEETQNLSSKDIK